jgi:hypothetical protein
MKLSLVSIAVLALSTAALAQTAATTTPAPQNINGRKENQQDRVAQGIQSGQLTAGETSKIEKNESSINHEERDMRKLDNGKLTSADRATLQQQQNSVSKQIYTDKHNAATQPKANGPIDRKENQQDRIAQGVKSGSLTPSETAKLESKQASINHEEHNMRAADNGHLTGQDKAALNKRQNNQSKAIYKDKHNGKER